MNTQTDILVIGGGIIGLAIAVELRQRGASVTVLTRDTHNTATRAAAGMLAPHAEGIEPGPLLDLCEKSLFAYPDWVRKLEAISGLPTHYWACGILAPVYHHLATTAVSDTAGTWLDASAIRHAQPGLGADVVGGWWFPEDGQVSPRALAEALYHAAETLGVDIHSGVTVEALQQSQGRVTQVQTSAGDWAAQHYVLAAGAWSHTLLPLPVQPRKGQMMSVRLPSQGHVLQEALPLRQVLFGEDAYVVPRQDGRIIIGATVESVGFTPENTLAGIRTLIERAVRLYPLLDDLPVEETWWGFRPTTPDEWPILGESHCANLTLATGHHRNGILLAPVTARLIADWVWHQQGQDLLRPFRWQRFHQAEAGPASITIPPSTLPSHHPPAPMQTLNSTAAIADTASGTTSLVDTPLIIAGRTFQSRLMTGTGKYSNFDDMRASVAASGCQIVTVAVRRVQTNAPGHEGLAEALDWSRIWMLPNTAGCKTAEDAVRVARLGREMAKLLGQEDNNFVKLEVIPDAQYLLPDPIGTLQAAEQLVKEGFAVLPYINADPLLAKRLEEVGCATVMPLGSPIGSGQGIQNAANIRIIIENATVPVVVDAGIGAPSEATQAMEMGADALLINTAIARAKNPPQMARAMGLATEAGRLAFLAGRIPVQAWASASSPTTGTITS